MTVICVLRSGGVYTPEWVTALQQGVASHLSGHSFYCLTDVSVPGAACIPLRHDWPGWWAKLEIFRPGLFSGPVLYLDLDTVPVGDLSEIAGYTGPFAALSDLYTPRKLATGVMAFTPGEHTARAYETFARDPQAVMATHRSRSDPWYERQFPGAERLQDLYPGQIVSGKREGRTGPPDGVRLVCFHGPPRLSDGEACRKYGVTWAHQTFRERAA